eukprot:1161744-Pelagomonas_calceolata.AAC.6
MHHHHHHHHHHPAKAHIIIIIIQVTASSSRNWSEQAAEKHTALPGCIGGDGVRQDGTLQSFVK